MNVILKVSDQFGPKGPQSGERGITSKAGRLEAESGHHVWVDDERWYKVLFPGFEGYYFLPERMLEFIDG